jgi:iron complex outermembrane receptor protein
MDSTGLGDHSRERGHVSLIPSVVLGSARLTAGLRFEAFSGDSPAYLPQAGVDVAVSDSTVVYASYTETVRQPSYTELNYESPGSLGNEGLERQHSRSSEVGCRWNVAPEALVRLAVFHRRSRHTVDWARPDSESTRWIATDLGDMDTFGAEAEVSLAVDDALDARAVYTWLDKEADLDVHASRYALDYADHLLKLALVWRVSEQMRFVATQSLQWQAENAARTSNDFATPGNVSCILRPSPDRPLELAFSVANLWDDDYEVLPGQQAAGRRISGALTMEW